MPRISVVEQYDNKDLIQQIYRLKELVETGTASNIAVTDNHDGTITVDVTMRDGSIQTFTLANDNIATIAAVQSGGDVTVTVTFESGSTQSFTFNVASGKVDVLTTAGSYVYTHTGATQNEQKYAINAVAGSIMQRDASGQTEVQSPASDTDSDYVVNMTKLNARLTDGSVTKIGTSNLGTDTKPIKLVAGVPTVVTNDLVDLPSTQAITGTKTVPLEATGTFSNQIASSNKVKNELDNYSPMLRDTGNKVVAGVKNFTGSLMSTGQWENKNSSNLESTSTWRRVYYNDSGATNQMLVLLATPQKPPQGTDEFGILMIGNATARWILKGSDIITTNFIVTLDSNNVLSLWVKNYNGNRGISFIKLNETNWGNPINNWKVDGSTVDPSFDPNNYVSHVVSS